LAQLGKAKQVKVQKENTIIVDGAGDKQQIADRVGQTAAFVADNASSILSFLSFISTSVAAPTPITATPPAIFAKRSCNCSLS